MWETSTGAASFHARLNVAPPPILGRIEVPGAAGEPPANGNWRGSIAGAGRRDASILHRFRSTVAGFWFKASKGPASPSPTVTISAAATTPAALPACQTKLSVISRVTISQAATEPALTPKIAVANPIIRYFSAWAP